MSLQWNFNRRCGTITEKSGDNSRTFNWYEGNAFMIMLDEDEKEYNLHNFFSDETHAKKMLGLVKGYSNVYTDYGETVTEITINKKMCRQWQKVMTLFAKAFPEITIKVYEEE